MTPTKITQQCIVNCCSEGILIPELEPERTEQIDPVKELPVTVLQYTFIVPRLVSGDRQAHVN